MIRLITVNNLYSCAFLRDVFLDQCLVRDGKNCTRFLSFQRNIAKCAYFVLRKKVLQTTERYLDSEERRLKLIIRVITFELFQPICPRYLNVTDRQTDGQTDGRSDGRTDGRTTYDSNTALTLRASRGNYCTLLQSV